MGIKAKLIELSSFLYRQLAPDYVSSSTKINAFLEGRVENYDPNQSLEHRVTSLLNHTQNRESLILVICDALFLDNLNDAEMKSLYFCKMYHHGDIQSYVDAKPEYNKSWGPLYNYYNAMRETTGYAPNIETLVSSYKKAIPILGPALRKRWDQQARYSTYLFGNSNPPNSNQ